MSMLRNLLMKKVKKEEEEPTSPFIDFADPEVKRICVDNWGGATGGTTGISGTDGEITYEQAAASISIFSFRTAFQGNTTIEYFNELQYFTGTKWSGELAYFRGCSNLKEVTLPSNITGVLGTTATGNDSRCLFQNCTSLYKCDFNGSKITALGSRTFFGCSSLTSVTLPDTVVTLGMQCFSGASVSRIDGLNHVTATYDTALNCRIEHISFDGDVSLGSLYPNNTTKSISAGGKITASSNNMFRNMSQLESISCNGFACGTTNASYMFTKCSSITDWSFLEGCDFSKITNSSNMFEGTGINKIYELGTYSGGVFSNCKNISGVLYLPTKPNYTFITSATFVSYAKINAVILPNQTSTIGVNAFNYCSELELVDVGLLGVAANTAYRYKSGVNFVSRSADGIGSCGFNSLDLKNLGKVFVPSSLVDTVKSTTGWSTCADKIFAIGGAEWVAEFGSADEYADYIKYGVEPPTE